MKKKLKNSLCLLLAAVMLACSVPVLAAESGDVKLAYAIIDGEATVLGLKEDLPEDFGGTLVIPSQIEGVPVTKIGNNAFIDVVEITDVTLPDGLKDIGSNAFYETEYFNDESKRENGALYNGKYLLDYSWEAENKQLKVKDGTVLIADYSCCDNYALQSLTVPASVKYIGDFAFLGCENLADVTLPDTLEGIGREIFLGTAVYANEKYIFNNALYVGKYMVGIEVYEYIDSDYYVKEGTELIANGMFKETYATMVSIPASVKVIGDCCFEDTPYLKKIAVDKNNQYFCNDANGVLYTKDMKTIICYPDAKPNASYEIPSSVEVIADYVFSYATNIKTMVIPSNVKVVYPNSFKRCKIENLEVYGVEEICDELFSDCLLETLVIGDGVRKIGYNSFYSNVITEIKLPASVETSESFSRHNFPALQKFTVSKDSPYFAAVDGVLFAKDMKTLVQYPCAKVGDKYTVPDGIEIIGEYAFDNTQLCEITLADSVRELKERAFSFNDYLAKINFGSGLEIVGEEAFCALSITGSFVLPEGVKTIGDFAFYSSEFTSVTLPSTIESIGENIFDFCLLLEEINVAPGNKNFKSVDGVLYNADLTKLIAFPSNSKIKNMVIPSTVSEFTEGAFAYSQLEEVTLPSAIKSVPQNLFYGAEELTKVVIPEGVETIESEAFNGCYSLVDVTLPSTLRCIEKRAFAFCTSLVTVDIPKNVTEMSGTSFEYCYSIEEVNVQDGGAFVDVDGVIFTKDMKTLVIYPAAKSGNSYEIPEGVEIIGNCSFESNLFLQNVVIPEGVKEIGYDAFYDASLLSTITVSSSVEKVGDWAFYSIYPTLSIYFEGTEEEWYQLEEQADFYPTGAYVAFEQTGPNLFEKIEQAFLDFFIGIGVFWQMILSLIFS